MREEIREFCVAKYSISKVLDCSVSLIDFPLTASWQGSEIALASICTGLADQRAPQHVTRFPAGIVDIEARSALRFLLRLACLRTSQKIRWHRYH